MRYFDAYIMYGQINGSLIVKKHSSLLSAFFVMFSCTFSLCACDNTYVSWSPDGKSMAFAGHDGLHFADPEGNLSPASKKAAQIAWLPDSKRLLLVESGSLKKWTDAKTVLNEEEEKQAMDFAAYLKDKLLHNPVEALETDQRLKDTPGFILESALLYLKDSEKNLKELFGEEKAKQIQPDDWSLDLNQISMADANSPAERKELWHGFEKVTDLKVSPDGNYAFFVCQKDAKSGLYDLELLPLNSNDKALKVKEIANQHAAWSADSQKAYFIEGLNTPGEKAYLGALSCQELRDKKGELFKDFPKAQKLLYLAFDQGCDISCLKDGRIIFTANDTELPATASELTAFSNLYSYKEGDEFARKLMSLADTKADSSFSPLRVNPDGTMAILGNAEWLPVLDLQSGKLQKLKIGPKIQACWRNSDELCFAVPLEKTGANKHKSEIVLHSMSTGKEKTLSANWPAAAVTDILIEKAKK